MATHSWKSMSLAAALVLAAAHPADAQVVCDGRYHWIDVPGTKCMDGTATGLQYACLNGSASGPLLVYVEGGGGCFDGATCDCQADANGNCQNSNAGIVINHFNRAQSWDGQLWGQAQSTSSEPFDFGQQAAFSGPASPFKRDWNILYIPYCTGDGHAGDRQRHYQTIDGRTIDAWHHGFTNVALDLLRARKLFPSPSKVAVWGSSAGSIGADCNLERFRQQWPDVPMWAMMDAGYPFSTAWTPSEAATFGGAAGPLEPGFSEAARALGLWHSGDDGQIIADTCPAVIAPDAQGYNLLFVQLYNSLHLPDVRKAFTDDYADATMEGFSCQFLGAAQDADGTCDSAFRAGLLDAAAQIGDDPNYRVYYHDGSCHTERESDGNASCDFDVTPTSGMVQDGVAFSDWVNAWIAGDPKIPNPAFFNVK
jgi:hypothetical protein